MELINMPKAEAQSETDGTALPCSEYAKACVLAELGDLACGALTLYRI